MALSSAHAPTLSEELMDYWPVVSCIINTYNRADLMPRALQSVYNQFETFKNFEVIVVDDASTDSTPDVIVQWGKYFDELGVPFRAFRLGENSGYQAVPKNMGIEQARGDYIRFLDDDNEWTQGSLKALVERIREGDIWPDVVYGRREYVLDEGAPETDKNGNMLMVGASALVRWDDDALRRISASCYGNFIDTSDALIAKGAFWWLQEHTGNMWNPSYRRFGDWELFCRAANLHNLLGVPPWRFKELDMIVQKYHWTGNNLQLVRPLHETPVAKPPRKA